MDDAKSQVLFNQARDALQELGFREPPTYESWTDSFGPFDYLRGLCQAVEALLPRIGLDHAEGHEFYMSFQPLPLAKDIKTQTNGDVDIGNQHLDAHEMVWEHTVNGVSTRLDGGERTADRFVEDLNVLLEREGIAWCFTRKR